MVDGMYGTGCTYDSCILLRSTSCGEYSFRFFNASEKIQWELEKDEDKRSSIMCESRRPYPMGIITAPYTKKSDFDFLDTDKYKNEKQKTANETLYSNISEEELRRVGEYINQINKLHPSIELGKATTIKPKNKDMKQHIYFIEDIQELLTCPIDANHCYYIGELKTKVIKRIQKFLDGNHTSYTHLIGMIKEDPSFKLASDDILDVIQKTLLKDSEYKPTAIHLFIRPNEVSKLLDEVLSEHEPKVKPKLEDKMLVWTWDDRWTHNRELVFYDAKNECHFNELGKREEATEKNDNYKPFKGNWPKWAKKAYKTLEE